ncbi:2-succinyl-5-enolpyruvyl-6-hydroxy-3-cyclohexene-1-carboxylic-acid synthase [Brachybacterium phenoliresistens]|uniref:2-succinyl-5-enolpyruvyl-6-hydroxy-3-cyclohexene-1-carboxylate synthase n=1 Tax=Brachybacterium phenoliresistens TaxID=396014 RepID=Z9JUD0_9MICO|nr:2-succinyl-5-enolpyruvyl-6-hydroxy-3-cyclohexene-1-carboxylic-acid synthase [Brachybacterium phenoliresistens]EWS81970.1 2-succinyl-6-hydroxy-2,4-cyclohexadiene-1-carboxylate synthase [Brachybacterium phenoliresistens]
MTSPSVPPHAVDPADGAAPWPETSIDAPAPTGSGAVDEAVAIWRALAALGVREAVLAPGSRSAPLVHGLADPQVQARIRAHVRIDERAAAFTALGISRQDPAHPGVVATTSGTATAHLHAAVLEAHHSRVPLIVLTADRPAELRDTGANQTTRQAGLYGEAVRWSADLPAPTREAATAVELRTAVSTLARAVAIATGADPGPVHVNLGLRDPLVPRGGSVPGAAGSSAAAPAAAAPAAAPATDAAPAVGPIDGARERIVLTRRAPAAPPRPETVELAERAVVVAGDGAGGAALELAGRHRLPLLAEPSSGARSGDCAIPGYPRLLAEAMAEPDHPLRPRQAIVLGHPTLSRPVLGALLGAADVDVLVVDPTDRWADAARRARRVVPAVQARDPHPEGRETYLSTWQEASAASAAPAVELPWQVRAALAVWEATGPQDVLVLGSSSLVRDLEQHAGPMRGTVVANRGLAGIDGMISTATGYALARRGAPGRVRALMGDLTALHDLTGLVIGPDEAVPDLDVVVVDDGGGRIFTGLEHAAAPADLMRRFFTTPHGTDIAAAARALGVTARTVAASELPALLTAPAPAGASTGRRVLVAQQSHSCVEGDAGVAMV